MVQMYLAIRTISKATTQLAFHYLCFFSHVLGLDAVSNVLPLTINNYSLRPKISDLSHLFWDRGSIFYQNLSEVGFTYHDYSFILLSLVLIVVQHLIQHLCWIDRQCPLKSKSCIVLSVNACQMLLYPSKLASFHVPCFSW